MIVVAGRPAVVPGDGHGQGATGSGQVVAVQDRCIDLSVWAGSHVWRYVLAGVAEGGGIARAYPWQVGAEFRMQTWQRGDPAIFPGPLNAFIAPRSFNGYITVGSCLMVNVGGGPHLIDPTNGGGGGFTIGYPYVPPGATTFRLYRNGSVIDTMYRSAPGGYPYAELDPLGIGSFYVIYAVFATPLLSVSAGDTFWVTCETQAEPSPGGTASGVQWFAEEPEVV